MKTAAGETPAEHDSHAPAHVIVIGAGVAGSGAALAALRRGANVTLLDGGTGASTLASGALDFAPWSPGHTADDPISREAEDALGALAGYALPQGGALVLTLAGVVRPARGHDRALLNVRGTKGCVGVAACRRPGWDGAALARAWNDCRGADAPDAFESFDVNLVRHTDEHSIPDADFAARHDDEERLTWLVERLRDAVGRAANRYSAIVLPPMLGLAAARAETLSERLGIRCGEVTSPPGGPSGLRFESARDRAIAAAGATRLFLRAKAVERRGSLWRIVGEEGEALEGDAVVLATGGLIGGGLAYAPSDAMFGTELPKSAASPIELTVRAPVVLGARGRPLEAPGSLFGYAPESLSRPFVRDALLDRAGVLRCAVESDGNTLLGAGDVVADEPRTWLAALASGVSAGNRAAAAVMGGAISAASQAATSSGARLPTRL